MQIPLFSQTMIWTEDTPGGSTDWILGDRTPEEWRPIPGLEQYEMSDAGRVRDTDTKLMRHILMRDRYTSNRWYAKTFPELARTSRFNT